VSTNIRKVQHKIALARRPRAWSLGFCGPSPACTEQDIAERLSPSFRSMGMAPLDGLVRNPDVTFRIVCNRCRGRLRPRRIGGDQAQDARTSFVLSLGTVRRPERLILERRRDHEGRSVVCLDLYQLTTRSKLRLHLMSSPDWQQEPKL
jgi:hypothetical protein